MSAAGIYIDIDGEPVDLDQVSWYLKAPCGCVAGATVGHSDYGPGPARVTATADAAMACFYETAAERSKYQALGFTAFAGRREDVTSLMVSCAHEPKWGYAEPARPDGMTWAVGGWHGERTGVLHLVPTKNVEGDTGGPAYDDWKATALCGVEKGVWSRARHLTDGKVECKRCVAKASAA